MPGEVQGQQMATMDWMTNIYSPTVKRKTENDFGMHMAFTLQQECIEMTTITLEF